MPRSISTWNPVIGETAIDFINGITFLDDAGRRNVIDSSIRILSRVADPSKENQRKSTLVLGEVQSGKTLSFTTLIALARDNQIPVTVLLAGTKRPLMAQTLGQLTDDLNSNSSGQIPRWFISSTTTTQDKLNVNNALKSWVDPLTPTEFRQSVVLVTMKTPAGIRKAATFLKSISETQNKIIPCLIIDDEGDQASPNTKVAQENEFSETYTAISELRDQLLNHSFVSYTATPEAQLLMALTDHLSPESVVVLNPGNTYVGVKKLFVDQSTFFKIPIADDEAQIAANPGPGDIPPKSLSASLAYFLLCLAINQKSVDGVKPVSMLIHPASAIDSHTRYKIWIKSILDKWKLFLDETPTDSPLFAIPKEFAWAITEFEKTNSLITVFPNLSPHESEIQIARLIHFWLSSSALEIRVVNSEKKAHNVEMQEWGSKSGWILIGAGKLDRGFVVKNLVVTYMPRGIGGGNVDTIQQRGRFFGHKSQYLHLLRGWFSNETIQAFKDIYETEKHIREDLKSYDENGWDLRDWRRNMIMGTNMRPTRTNVVGLNNSILDLKDNTWFQQRELFDPVLPEVSRDSLQYLVNLMEESSETQLDRRNTEKKHKFVNIPLLDLVALLVDWPATANDKQTLDKYLVLFSAYARSQGSTQAVIYFMNQLEPRKRSSDLRYSEGFRKKYWKIQNLQEGRRDLYPGDKFIRSEDAITIQVHNVIPRKDANDDGMPEVLALAISWPNGFKRRVLQQD